MSILPKSKPNPIFNHNQLLMIVILTPVTSILENIYKYKKMKLYNFRRAEIIYRRLNPHEDWLELRFK